MARSSDPNSANNNFFCFKPAPFLDNQYTVFGVIEGMEFVDKINVVMKIIMVLLLIQTK